MRLALLQSDIAWHDAPRNRGHFEELLEDLDGKADMAVLPEMFTTGFSMDVSQAEVFNTDTCRWLKMAADRLNMAIVGSVMTTEKGKYYNRCLVARPGQPLVWYDKRHLFRMDGEHEVYTPGAERIVFEYKGWRICPLVCYDLRFPVFSRNTPQAYDLLLYVANWPERRALAWNRLLPARAIENQCYCAGVNAAGASGNGTPFAGDSQVIDYLGEDLLHLGKANQTGIVTLSYDSLTAYRQAFPAWKDADPFTLT